MARGAWQGTVHGVTESDYQSPQSCGYGWQNVSTTFLSTWPLLTTCLCQLSGSIWALFLSPGEGSETKIEHCALPRLQTSMCLLSTRTTPTWVGVWGRGERTWPNLTGCRSHASYDQRGGVLWGLALVRSPAWAKPGWSYKCGIPYDRNKIF